MVPHPRNGLSLCAGSGALDFGLQIAEPGYHARCFVEWAEYPRKTLVAGMDAGYIKPAPIWDDLTTFDGRPWRGHVDTIIGGYPCQPFSQAGQRRGENDERHLWPHIARIIDEIRPTWCFFENVSGHFTLGFETVYRQLCAMGFTVAAGEFSAAETGASHERKRLFVLAHADSGSQQRADGRKPDAEPDRRHDTSRRGPETVAHRDGEYSQRRGAESHAQRRKVTRGHAALCGGTVLEPPAINDAGGWVNVLASHPDRAPAISQRDVWNIARAKAQAVEAGQLPETEAQRDVYRMVNGMAHRSRCLHMLGNGVYPLAVATAYRTLRATIDARRAHLGANRHAAE